MADKTIGSIKIVAKKIQDLPKDNYVLSKVVNEKYSITFKELFIDLDRAIARVIALCITKNQFKDISSFAQRENILKYLKLISNIIIKSDDFLLELDNLKSEIKNFAYMKYVKSSATDIENEAAKLRKEKSKLMRAVRTVSNNVEKTAVNIEKSKENQITLNTLGKTLDKHNEQLKQQDEKYEAYDKKITKYNTEKNTAIKNLNEEQLKLLKQAEEIIEQAQKSMKLGEASGISSALQTQYNEIKGEKNTGLKSVFNMFIGAKIWVWGALLFSMTAIGIGIWLGYSEILKINTIFARISLIFISLTGAWFCAGQYVKISNIATDYAYKVSLAKSIVAFSEQLKNDDEKDTSYQDYIKKILDEIHQHPLRSYKKQEGVTPIEKVVEIMMEKMKSKNNDGDVS